MDEINSDHKTIDVCREILQRHKVPGPKKEQKNVLSECVVLCKRSGNGLLEITKGVAKLFEEDKSLIENRLIVSDATKIMFIVE